MVSGQNEAERRKADAETLSRDLEQQNKRIAERRDQVRPLGFQRSITANDVIFSISFTPL